MMATEAPPETEYANYLLEDWGKWQRNDGINLRPAAAGRVLGINASTARMWDLGMSDDQFVVIDAIVAKFPKRLRIIVFVEYLEPGSQPAKWRRTGLNRLAYRQRLHAAQWALVTHLGDLIDKWRPKTLKTR